MPQEAGVSETTTHSGWGCLLSALDRVKVGLHFFTLIGGSNLPELPELLGITTHYYELRQ